MKVVGSPGVNDFVLSPSGELVASAKAVNSLREFGLKHCEVALYSVETRSDQDPPSR
jgi:hypothetical protein